LKRRSVFLFFLLPFLGVLVFFALSSVLSQADLKKRTGSLVRDQLAATSGILGATAAHFLDEGRSPEEALEAILSEEDLYFVALLDERKTVLAWNSRFEGYLPISLREAREDEPGIIDSPAGKIFSELATVSRRDGSRYYLYLGYALTGMEEMIALSRRTSFLLSGLFLLAGAAFFRAMFVLQSRYVAKAREAEAERLEKERFREISAFTSGVAHEIKNPLNSLSLLLELLQGTVHSGVKDEVALGKAELQKISRIIDSFSGSLKPLRPVKETASLREIVTAAHDALLREASKPEVEWRFSESRPVFLKADRELMIQCFLNLLRNAYEATDRGIVAVEAEIRRKRITVRVWDTGRGIETDRLPLVFDPFFTTKEKGMGVGLYLARKIIEAHGGRIGVESPPSQGTTFTIQLPGGSHE